MNGDTRGSNRGLTTADDDANDADDDDGDGDDNVGIGIHTAYADASTWQSDRIN